MKEDDTPALDHPKLEDKAEPETEPEVEQEDGNNEEYAESEIKAAGEKKLKHHALAKKHFRGSHGKPNLEPDGDDDDEEDDEEEDGNGHGPKKSRAAEWFAIHKWKLVFLAIAGVLLFVFSSESDGPLLYAWRCPWLVALLF